MKKGTIIFKGSADDKNTYQLTIERYVAQNPSSTLNGKLSVSVVRNFRGDVNSQDGVPSGWFLDQVENSNSLCIDGGQNWNVYPTQEVWNEIIELAKGL